MLSEVERRRMEGTITFDLLKLMPFILLLGIVLDMIKEYINLATVTSYPIL